jgi:hypothetical protein
VGSRRTTASTCSAVGGCSSRRSSRGILTVSLSRAGSGSDLFVDAELLACSLNEGVSVELLSCHLPLPPFSRMRDEAGGTLEQAANAQERLGHSRAEPPGVRPSPALFAA